MLMIFSRFLSIFSFLIFSGFCSASYDVAEEKSNIKTSIPSQLVTSQSSQERDTVWVLSVDGGGVRGIIPAYILSRIENAMRLKYHIDMRIADLFQLVAGNSTGSLITLGLTVPDDRHRYRPKYTAKTLVDLYRKESKDIFPNAWWREIAVYAEDKYNVNALEKILLHYFNDTHLHEAVNDIHTLVPAFNISQNKIYFCDGYNEKAAIKDNKKSTSYLMREVARASTAAPTFFKAARIDNEKFIDGGVFMNNPAHQAYLRARQIYPQAKKIILVSLGTGDANEKLPENLDHSGMVKSAQPIINIMVKAASDLVDRTLETLVELNPEKIEYYRIQTQVEETVLDKSDPETISKLESAAAETVGNNVTLYKLYDKIKALCEDRIALIDTIFSDIENKTEINLKGFLLRDSDFNNLNHTLQSESQLVSLNLSRCALTAVKLEALCNALQKNTTLKSLDISENGISEELNYLGTLLNTNKTLKELSLSKNKIQLITRGKDGVEMLLRRANRTPTSLTLLDLSGNMWGGKATDVIDIATFVNAIVEFQDFSPIKNISFSNNNIKTGYIPLESDDTLAWDNSLKLLADKMPDAIFDFTNNDIDDTIKDKVKSSSYNTRFKF